MPVPSRTSPLSRLLALAVFCAAIAACSGPGWRSTPIEPGARSVTDFPPANPERGGADDTDESDESDESEADDEDAAPAEPASQPTSQPTSQPSSDPEPAP